MSAYGERRRAGPARRGDRHRRDGRRGRAKPRPRRLADLRTRHSRRSAGCRRAQRRPALRNARGVGACLRRDDPPRGRRRADRHRAVRRRRRRRGLRPGAIVVLSSTVDPVYPATLAPRLAERGIRLLDSPVSGGPAKAAAGTMTMMVSGDAGALRAHAPGPGAHHRPIVRARPPRGRCLGVQDRQQPARRRQSRRRRRGDGARDPRGPRSATGVRRGQCELRRKLDLRRPDRARARQRLCATRGDQDPDQGCRHRGRARAAPRRATHQ